MAKIINISDKLSMGKPVIKVHDKEYPVNDSLETVMKFEEMYGENGDIEGMLECMKIALGESSYNEINFSQMSFKNIQTWFIAIMAAMQDMDYDEVATRFHEYNSAAH